jgi:hypothetical protein
LKNQFEGNIIDNRERSKTGIIKPWSKTEIEPARGAEYKLAIKCP